MPLEIVRSCEAELGADVYIGEAVFDKGTQTPVDFYREYLDTAARLEVEALALPLITSDGAGTPGGELLGKAVSLIGGFLENRPDLTVYLTVEEDDIEAFGGGLLDERFDGRFADLGRYIEEARLAEDVIGAPPAMAQQMSYGNMPAAGNAPDAAKPQKKKREGLFGAFRRRATMELEMPEVELREEKLSESDLSDIFTDELGEPEDLDEKIRSRESTFQEHLFRLIDRKGMDDVEVYKKANIDRKLFSKIKSNPYYRPSKRTALAFAVALNLSIDETRDLLLKAGIALTRSDPFDIIMEYCIERGIYNINEINCVLFRYEQPLLGA